MSWQSYNYLPRVLSRRTSKIAKCPWPLPPRYKYVRPLVYRPHLAFMNPLPSSSPAHRPDPAMDTLLAAAWQSIQQVSILPVYHSTDADILSSPHRRVSVKFSTPTVPKAMATETCSLPCSTPRPPRTRSVDPYRRHHPLLMPLTAHSLPRGPAEVYARNVPAHCACATRADHSALAYQRAFAKPLALRALAPLSISLPFYAPVSRNNALASAIISPSLQPIASSALT